MAATEALLRVLLNDPAGPDQLEPTESYTAIIALETNEYRAAATMARVIAAKFSDETYTSIDGDIIDDSRQAKAYLALAKQYDQRAREGGGDGTGKAGSIVGGPVLTGTSVSEIDSVSEDEDRFDSVFYRGVLDNPETDTDRRE